MIKRKTKMVILTFLFILGISSISFIISDNISLRTIHAQGTIINKEHHASYNTTQMIMIGKVWIPQTIVHPEEWIVDIVYKDVDTRINVSVDKFNKFNIGDLVPINIHISRYTKQIAIVGLE